MEDESVFAYFKEHADDIAAEGEKPFQAIGGMVDMLMGESPAEAETHAEEKPAVESPAPAPAATPARAPIVPKPAAAPKRENTFQKINRLDVKGRIQLALKGNKEERSILIRDGTKVVALAVLEAPKLSDGEVEKFACQKNVLEAVLRQIPLKRRFMKNYIVVRNLVANPRTPLDLALGLMKNLLIAGSEESVGQQRSLGNDPQAGAEDVQAETGRREQEIDTEETLASLPQSDPIAELAEAIQNNRGGWAFVQSPACEPWRLRLHAEPWIPHHPGESADRRMSGRESLSFTAGCPREDRHREYLSPPGVRGGSCGSGDSAQSAGDLDAGRRDP